jgi:hypothetical protein
MDDRTTPRWTADEDNRLRELFLTHTHEEIGTLLGKTRASVRNRAWRLCLRKKEADVSDEERRIIHEHYTACSNGAVNLASLAERLNRSEATIAKIAQAMGLTNQRRQLAPRLGGLTPSELRRLPRYASDEERRVAMSEQRKLMWSTREHPRGALGMKHTEETKARLAETSRQWQAKVTPEQREAHRVKRNETNVERYGTAGPAMLSQSNPYSRAKSGKREDLGIFVRSAWEANYARYLNWLKEQGQIAGWEYEPQTFVFHGVTRGVLTYTPDFKVIEHDGSYCWHEVKGWMDPKSKAKLKRMAKFYPAERIIVIGEDEYRALAKWKALIPEWETVKTR